MLTDPLDQATRRSIAKQVRQSDVIDAYFHLGSVYGPVHFQCGCHVAVTASSIREVMARSNVALQIAIAKAAERN
jgi:hypothetical protein